MSSPLDVSAGRTLRGQVGDVLEPSAGDAVLGPCEVPRECLTGGAVGVTEGNLETGMAATDTEASAGPTDGVAANVKAWAEGWADVELVLDAK